MTVIAVAGDWHGNTQHATARIVSLGERGITTLVHAGDFGIWPGPGGKRFLERIDATARRYGVEQIRVVPGNHEDHGRLTQLWSSRRNRDTDGSPLPLQLTQVISVLPRGHRWEVEGRTFVALGGAPSLDYASRKPGHTWWSEEMIEPEDVARTVSGGYADVMITHDAPGPPYATRAVTHVLDTNPMGWSDQALAYAAVGRERVTEAFLGVAPRLLVHGHLHVSDQVVVRVPGRDYDTRVWSLDCDGKAGNMRLLDLATLDDPKWGRHE